MEGWWFFSLWDQVRTISYQFFCLISSLSATMEELQAGGIINLSHPRNYGGHLTLGLCSRSGSLIGVISTSGVIMSFLRGSLPRLLYWMCFPRSLSALFRLIQISACMSPQRCLGRQRDYPPQSPSLSCFCFNCFTALISDIVFLFSYLLPVSRS